MNQRLGDVVFAMRKPCYLCTILFLLLMGAAPIVSADVNIYSARNEILMRPLLDAFTERTGIKIKLLTAKADALLERIKLEGKNSPADIFITVDAARLYRAKKLKLLQPIHSEILTRVVPAPYRDKDGEWYGLSLRSRVILVAKDRIKPSAINSYRGLADPRWKGRVCIRSSNNVYNQSLSASVLHHRGETQTLKWVQGLVANFARKPSGGDREQIMLVASGVCDIAVANTYYLGKMLKGNDPKQKKAAQQMQLIWPDQDGNGAHINVSAGGILRSSKNKQEAQKLLEFLVSQEAQTLYSQKNYEYPIRQDIELSDLLKQWGPFKSDSTSLNTIGELNPQAVKIMDRGGWL